MEAVLTRKRLTPAGQRTLLNVSAGLGAWHGISGIASHGGHRSTILALRRAGLLTPDEALTVEGRMVVLTLKQGTN